MIANLSEFLLVLSIGVVSNLLYSHFSLGENKNS